MRTPLERLGNSVKRLQHRHHRTVEELLAPLGVTLAQWHALREIDQHPGSSQLRLAELTFNSAQAFGTLVTRMEKAGLVTRETGAGRAFAVHLSPKGVRLLMEGEACVLEALMASFQGLSDKERASLQRLLDKALAG